MILQHNIPSQRKRPPDKPPFPFLHVDTTWKFREMIAFRDNYVKNELGIELLVHINHEGLVKILQASKPVKDTLRLSGKAIIEDMEFSRVLIGRISVTEIAALIERHGERLLERNIRRYLGLQGNQINEGIRDTLNSDEKTENFKR